MQRARLYIVEEQELFREAYKAFFPSEPTIDLVGISEDRSADRLLEELAPLNANAVLIGTKMLEPGIVEELEVLRENYPDLGLTLLSSFYDIKGIKRLREFAKKRSKGCAYLLKYSIDSIGQLTQVVHETVAGRVILDPVVMEGLIESGDAKAAILKELTSRELEVLNWMSKGYRNNTIAEVLCLDPKTVERHINGIYSKLSTVVESKHPRVNAVMLYLRATGQLPSEETSLE